MRPLLHSSQASCFHRFFSGSFVTRKKSPLNSWFSFGLLSTPFSYTFSKGVSDSWRDRAFNEV